MTLIQYLKDAWAWLRTRGSSLRIPTGCAVAVGVYSHVVPNTAEAELIGAFIALLALVYGGRALWNRWKNGKKGGGKWGELL